MMYQSFSSDDSDIDIWDDFAGDCSDGEADQWMGCTCTIVNGRWEDICYAHTCRTHTVIDTEIDPPFIEVCDERVMGEEFTACEEHMCTFQCDLPTFSFEDDGYGGPYCKDIGDPLRGIEGKGHCRHNHNCEFHTGCEQTKFAGCRFIRCGYPGCDPCLSHIYLCAFCHEGKELSCQFHGVCKCGTPILLENEMCANCAFVKRLFSQKRSRLHTLPTEVVELIQQFVLGGQPVQKEYRVEKIGTYELFPASSPHASVPLDELICIKANHDQNVLDDMLDAEELSPFEGDCADYEEAFQGRRRAKRD